jgi:septal ring factor EnvC (AmiA/AmiB activator)
MDALERKKLELQLKKVDTAIAELEYKIAERQVDIERMEEHIALQKKQEQEIKNQLGTN